MIQALHYSLFIFSATIFQLFSFPDQLTVIDIKWKAATLICGAEKHQQPAANHWEPPILLRLFLLFSKNHIWLVRRWKALAKIWKAPTIVTGGWKCKYPPLIMMHVVSKCDYTNRMVCNTLVMCLRCFKIHYHACTLRNVKDPEGNL